MALLLLLLIVTCMALLLLHNKHILTGSLLVAPPDPLISDFPLTPDPLVIIFLTGDIICGLSGDTIVFVFDFSTGFTCSTRFLSFLAGGGS